MSLDAIFTSAVQLAKKEVSAAKSVAFARSRIYPLERLMSSHLSVSGDPDPREDPRKTRFLEPRRTCSARRRAAAARSL